MAYRFTDPSNFAYSSGSIFLGLDPETGHALGIETERHAITIGGAGAGKGATLLIPNALRWPHNLLCIDVKGENAAATWEAREALGQHVGVLDPYQIADVPARLRVSINPLAGLDAAMPTIAEDLRFIADGMIIRAKREDAGWDDGARDILAGLMAYIVAEAPPEHRTLSAMRRLLMQPNEALYEDAQRMAASDACGGLAAAAGVTLMAGIESESGRPSKFIEGARSATLWLDSAPMKTALGSSSFDLSDLKRGKASLFLVLPPKYLASAAGFFRLFVQSAIAAMQSSARIERRCLFLLDEFHTLGKMEEISKAAGLMRGYGLHLWPFLQDLGQLHELYGATGSETFFGNADVAAFLGNGDVLTLEYISRRLGKLTPEEIAAPPDITTATAKYAHASAVAPDGPKDLFPSAHYAVARNENERRRVDTANENERRRVDLENAKRRAAYEHVMRRVGSPRMTPDEIAPMVGKGHGDVVARSMIVFGPSGAVLNVRPAPYFEPMPAPAPAPQNDADEPLQFGLTKAERVEIETSYYAIQPQPPEFWDSPPDRQGKTAYGVAYQVYNAAPNQERVYFFKSNTEYISIRYYTDPSDLALFAAFDHNNKQYIAADLHKIRGLIRQQEHDLLRLTRNPFLLATRNTFGWASRRRAIESLRLYIDTMKTYAARMSDGAEPFLIGAGHHKKLPNGMTPFIYTPRLMPMKQFLENLGA